MIFTLFVIATGAELASRLEHLLLQAQRRRVEVKPEAVDEAKTSDEEKPAVDPKDPALLWKTETLDLEPSQFDINKLSTKTQGEGMDYRMYFYYGDQIVSPWHDIPLYANKENKDVHFLCEIPKWTRAKYQTATKEKDNPIYQDSIDGKPRLTAYGDMIFNYGALPQTWEDPKLVDKNTKAKGDNDPIDVLEVGIKEMKSGEFAVVRVLGVLALVDSGETDWKLIVLRTNDRLAQWVNNLADLEREQPGTVDAIRTYFTMYKTAEGKPENKFGYNGECKDAKFANAVIEETHQHWRMLVHGNATVA